MSEGEQFGEARFWVLDGGPGSPAVAMYRVWGTTFDIFDGAAGDWRRATPAEMEETQSLFQRGALKEVPEMMAAMAGPIISGNAQARADGDPDARLADDALKRKSFDDAFTFWTYSDDDGDTVGLIRRRAPNAAREVFDARIGEFQVVDSAGEERLAQLEAANRLQPVDGRVAARTAVTFREALGNLTVPALEPRPTATLPSPRPALSVEAAVPASARAAFASSGGAFAVEADAGVIVAALRGMEVARFAPAPTGSFAWSDAAFGRLAQMLLAYTVWTRQLQQNRSADTLMLRAALRSRLDGDALLAAAEAARCRITKKGSLTVKEYIVHHANLGDMVSVRVLRGQRHVVDVTWLSDLFPPLEYLASLEHE